MRHIGIILFLSMCSIAMMAQSAHKLLIEGDQSYLNEEYLTAEESYRKAQQKNSTTKSNFNLGNAVYQQERYEEAVQHYESTFNVAEDDLERANALYNLGNAQLNSNSNSSRNSSSRMSRIMNRIRSNKVMINNKISNSRAMTSSNKISNLRIQI